MKRIYKQPPVDDVKPLYKSKESTKNAPYYDPNDLHVHVWKTGKLAVGDNPKNETYTKGKLSIKDTTYCAVCHQIKNQFRSTVSENVDYVDDVLITLDSKIDNIDNSYSPHVNKNTEDTIRANIISADKPRSHIVQDSKYDSMFHGVRGIFDNYVYVIDND